MGSGRHPDPFVDMIGDMLLGGEPGEAVAPVAPGSSVALNSALGTDTSPVQGVVRDWGGFFFNAQAPQNPNGAGDVQGAITSAAVGRAVVPAGTKTISTGLIPVTGGSLVGAGVGATKLKAATGLNNPVINWGAGGNSILIGDVTVDANTGLSNGVAVQLVSTSKSTVQNVRVQNSSNIGLWFFACTDMLASNVEVDGTQGLQVNGSRIRVLGTRSSNTVAGGHGIALQGTGSTDVLIGDSLVNGSAGIGIAGGSNNSRVLVAGAISIGNTVHGVDVGSVTDSLITGVIAYNNNCGYSCDTGNRNFWVGIIGISNQTASGGSNGNGHIIVGPGTTSDMGIVGAKYYANGFHGFVADSMKGDILLAGIVSKNNAQVTAGGAGFKFGATNVPMGNVLINGVRGFDDQIVKTQAYAIDIAATSYNFFIAHADVRGNLTGGINDLGVNTHIHSSPGYNPRGALTPPAVPATTVILANPFNVDCMVYIAGGTLTAVKVGGLPTPAAVTLAQAGTGGTLGAATYAYRIAYLNTAGHTIESVEATIVVAAGTTNTVTLTIPWIAGAWGVAIYGRTSGAELLMVKNYQYRQWTDDGSITPSGAMPGTDTSGNTATGITAAAPAGAVHAVRVPWGSSISITYSVAPTWTWFGE